MRKKASIFCVMAFRKQTLLNYFEVPEEFQAKSACYSHYEIQIIFKNQLRDSFVLTFFHFSQSLILINFIPVLLSFVLQINQFRDFPRRIVVRVIYYVIVLQQQTNQNKEKLFIFCEKLYLLLGKLVSC